MLGNQALPFHFNTCPEVAPDCPSFAAVTAPGPILSVVTAPSPIFVAVTAPSPNFAAVTAVQRSCAS